MKNLIISLIISICIIVIASGCSKQKEKSDVSQTKVLENNSNQLYACPMHPYQVSTHPGKCPQCNMELEKIDASKHSEMMKKMMRNNMKEEIVDTEASFHQSDMTCCYDNQKLTSMKHKLYMCPMHKEQVSINPGKCSICGMDLKEISKEEYKKNIQKTQEQ